MTFSIVATDGTASGRQQCWGVAVASKFLAVGFAVPAAEADVGAIATQSYANLSYRPNGLALLRGGSNAQDTLDQLTAGDDERAKRQAGVVDRAGRAATYTGDECHDWAGGVTGTANDGSGYAIQGNILTGPEVVEEMQRAWLATDPAEPLARRLLAALVAGDDAGGDKRGRQSAAILVVTKDGGYGGGSDQLVDLRVDDHPRPIPELARLLDLHDVFFTRPDTSAYLEVDDALAAEVAGHLTRLGFVPKGDSLLDIGLALADWAGVENLEERVVPEPKIDPVVLDVLRAKAAAFGP